MSTNGLAAKIFPYIATALLGLLSFLGAALYSRQDEVADALHENSAAIRVLAQKFESYADLQDERFLAIKERLDRAGMQ